jgi:hypothetical protein
MQNSGKKVIDSIPNVRYDSSRKYLVLRYETLDDYIIGRF